MTKDHNSDLLSVYSTDVQRHSDQLGFILTIRGWAVTLFSAILGGTIFLKSPNTALINFVVIGIFYVLETTYDAYRILLFGRIIRYEKEFQIRNIFPEGVVTGFAEKDLAKIPADLAGARCKAAFHPTRLLVYLTLTITTLLVVFLTPSS